MKLLKDHVRFVPRSFHEIMPTATDSIVADLIKEVNMAWACETGTAYELYGRQAQQRAMLAQQQYAQRLQPQALGSAIGGSTLMGTDDYKSYANLVYTDASMTTSNVDGAIYANFFGRTFGSAAKVLKFFRVNEIVEMEEGSKFKDPVDELRLKVARWLKPKEKYNFA